MTPANGYDNGMGALAKEKGFLPFSRKGVRVISGRHLNFLDLNLPTGTETAQYEAQARNDFPYPPKDCNDAVSTANAIADKITSLNESIAAGSDIKNNQKRIAVLQKIKSDFETYVNKASCIQNALKADDQSFNDQWQSLLDKEQSAQTGKSNADTWIVFAALGLLFVGAIWIIFKKKKPE